MLIVLAKITAKEDKRKNIINEAETLIKATRVEKGCIEYNLYAPVDNPNVLLFVEKWEDKKDLDSHLEQPHFVKFGPAIENYLAEDLDISIYSSDEIEL